MPDPTLTEIVSAIRAQRPGLLPDFGASWQDAIRPDIAELAVQGALFDSWGRLYDSDLDDSINHVYFTATGGGSWVSSPMDGESNPTLFPPTTRGCILALCRAIGITLESADA